MTDASSAGFDAGQAAHVAAYHRLQQQAAAPGLGLAEMQALLAEALGQQQQLLHLTDTLARQAENKYRTLFSAIDEGFCLFELLYDAQGTAVDYRFLEVNQAFERQTGLTNVPGRLGSTLAPHTEPYWLDTYAQVARTGQPARFEDYHADTQRWYEVYVSRVEGAGSPQVCTVFNDITTRKRREADLALLAEVSQDLAGLTNIDDTLNALGEKLAAHLGLSACLFAELFEAAQIAVIAHGWLRADMPNLLRTYRTTEFMNDEIRELCLTGQPVVIRDVDADPRTDGAQYATLHVGSFVGMPLVRDGEWRFLLVVYRPEPYDWRDDEIELIRELTSRIWTRLERARAEEALRRSEERTRRVLETDAVGVIFFNHAGTLIQANSAFLAMTGYTHADVASGTLTWQALTPPEFIADSAAQMAQLGATGRIGPYEKEYFKKDGTRRWMLFAGRDLGDGTISEYCIDVTDRVRAEAALRDSEARLHVAVDAAELGTFVWHVAEDRNEEDARTRAHFGLAPDSTITLAEALATTFHPDDAPGYAAAVERAIDPAGPGTLHQEFRIRHPEGERWISVIGATTFAGTPPVAVRITGVLANITERKRQEQRQQFLLQLADALRPLADATQIQGEAARLLREWLDAGWCYYNEFDATGTAATIARDAGRAGLPSLVGTYDLSAVPEYTAYMRAGNVFNAPNLDATELFSRRVIEDYAALGMHAALGVPLVKAGQLLAIFIVADTAPRTWTAEEVTLLREVAERTWSAVARARAEAALRDSEARQAFLLHLSDALRPLVDATEIQAEATRILGQHLGVDRAYYVELHEAEGYTRVVQNYLRGDSPSLAGTYALSDYDWTLPILRRGETIVVDDTETSKLIPDDGRAALRSVAIRAHITSPLIKNGRVAGSLCVTEAVPRQWVASELAIIRETAERIWDAVERARTEQALRRSEAQLQVAVDAADLGTFVWYLTEDRTEADARALHHFGLPPDAEATLADSLARIFHPEDGPRYVEAIARAVDPAGSGTLHQEFRIRRSDGERWMSVVAATVFAGTPPVAVRITGVLADITERKQQQQHQEFLLQLADALRPLADPLLIQQAALRLVGGQLHLDRLLFNEIDPAVTTYTVRASYVREGFLAYGGQQPMGPFTESVRALQQGITKVVYDVETDESFSAEERAICASIGVRAFVVVPLLKKGQWVLNLVAHASEPRPWPPHEMSLLEETAERTWAAVERARAEEAVQQSEAKYRTLFESIDEGFCVFELQFDDQGNAVDWIYQEANPAFEQQTGYVNAVGRRISDLQPDLERSWFERFAEVARTGEPTRFVQETAAMHRWYDVYAFRVGAAGENRVALLFTDISERKRREANAALLAEVSQELSVLSAPDAIMHAVGERLGGFLGAAACIFADVDEAANEATIHHGWNIEGVSSLKQTFRLADYFGEEFRRAGRGGAASIVGDTGHDPRANAEAYAALGIGGFVTVPFQRHGRWVANITVTNRAPRDWRPDEIELLQEVAARVFPRIERARAERALQESEEKYRGLFTSIDEGFCLIEVLFDAGGRPVDYRFEEVNPVFEAQTGLHGAAGKTVLQLVPHFEPQWVELYGRIAQTGVPERFEADVESMGRVFDVYAFRSGEPGANLVGAIFNDITKRKADEARQAFLLEFSDALRPLHDPTAIQEEATRRLGQELAVSRAFYGEVEPDGNQFVVHRDFAAGVPSVAGRYAYTDFVNGVGDDWHAGRTATLDDIDTDERFSPAQRAATRAVGVRAWVSVPLVKNGRLVATFGLHQSSPRVWLPHEVALAEEVAERTWAAVERARTERALHESEQRLSLAVAASELGVWEWDLASDRAVGNAFFYEHFGLDPSAEHRGVDVIAGLHPDDIPMMNATLEVAMNPASDGHYTAEYRVLREGAGPRWLSSNGQVEFSGEGEERRPSRSYGTTLDITEQKLAEAVLRESEERQAFLLKLSDALRPLIDPVEILQTAMRVVKEHFGVDSAVYHEFDAAGDRVITREGITNDRIAMPEVWRLKDFGFEEDLKAGRAIWYEDTETDPRLQESRPSYREARIRAGLGVTLMKGGRLAAMVGLTDSEPRAWPEEERQLVETVAERTWEAVERARAERAVQESEAKYRTLFDTIDEGFATFAMITDDAGKAVDFRIVETNQAFARHSGLIDAAGKTAGQIAPQMEPSWLDVYAGVLKTGEAARFEEYNVDTNRWFSVHASRVGDSRSLLSVVLDDITGRKRREANLTFLAGVSHDLARLSNIDDMMAALGTKIGAHFGVSNVAFGEVDEPHEVMTVAHEWRAADARSFIGDYRISDFLDDDLRHTMRAGAVWVINDVQHDTRANAEPIAALGIGAMASVPFARGGEWLFNLTLYSGEARYWRDDELELLRETATRIWTRLERARVEAALHQSEEELHSFVTASSDALYRMDADWQHMRSMQGKEFLTPTDAPNETWLTQYIPPADQPTVQAAIQAAIAGRHFFELEHRVFQADGTVGWTFSRAVPVLNPQGELVEWFGTATDISARKAAEAARHMSEMRLRLALDAAELGTWDWNLATNEVYWNERHFTMLGWEPQPGPVTPDEFARAIHPDDRPEVLRRLQAAVDNNHLFEAEFRIVTPQEDVRWMSGHGQPTNVDAEGRVWRMTGVMLDVTEHKHAEQHLQDLAASLERKVARRTQALQESQQLLQSVYDTSLIGLAVLHAGRDQATGAITDFTFVSVNKELARLSGRPNLVGQRYGQAFGSWEPRGVRTLMEQAVETGRPQQSEFSYRYEGLTHWFAFMCVKLDGGVVATVLDITERKQAEQQLSRNLHLLEQAETVAQLGSWDYDLTTGQFYWSGGMYQLFGLPPGQPVVPGIYLDYVLADDRPRAAELVRQITTGARDFETTLRLQVGEAVKTVRIKAVVLRNAQGQAVRVLGVDLDLSELHRLEADNLRLRLSQQQALFEAVQAAEEAERRRMSESLHNGIGQILYATKLQLDRLPDAPELSPRREAAHLLGEAIRQTRALSHELTPAILEEFGLEKTLQSICTALNTPSLRWRCHLELAAAPALPLSLQLAVYRLAQELAQNVLKHAQATEATLEVDLLPAWVVLRVEDNGRGFDPDQTSDGLGLRSLRSRAALLGGTVHLTTTPGQGTQCQIRIPLPPSSL